ncbi:MAG: lipoyl(octanoyl) transferase LipB [Actinobacteria bacterium]|nr:lipoyl(octanoyl) transferase LipB [Actinomycetota bacterium]
MVDFVVTGLSANSVPYVEALELQRATHRAVVDGVRPDTVMFLEHPSVYTAGKRTEEHERPTDGTPVIDVDRGGKITWHGPGQLVGYPILHLEEPIDVVGYVRRLEGILIDALARLGVDADRVEGRSGVWLRGTDKIAAIGIRVSHGVTMHGFSLNCDNSFEAYDKIVACGLADAGVTSISRELGRDVTTAQVVPVVQAAFIDSMVMAR